MFSVFYFIASACAVIGAPGNEEKVETVFDILERIEKLARLAKHKITSGNLHSSNTLVSRPIDCKDWLMYGKNESGVYAIWPVSSVVSDSIAVYCDMETDGGGWTLIQRRGDFGLPAEDFYRDWIAYKEGFGNLLKEFWLGNDNIHALTSQDKYSIRVDMEERGSHHKIYAVYENFWIDDENSEYKMNISGYSGNAGNKVEFFNGNMFSTKDRDNDGWQEDNFANWLKGGWWYGATFTRGDTNLNGVYPRDNRSWHAIDDFQYGRDLGGIPLSASEIKIRRHA